MSYEVEIKARIDEGIVGQLEDRLSRMDGVRVLGKTVKEDTYYAVKETDCQLFRVRLQKVGRKRDILITAKPLRAYEGTEINEELEFHGLPDEFETIDRFFTSLGYMVCLKKIKSGWSCVVPFGGFDITAEIFRVNDLGFFLEMEITSIESCEDESGISKAQKALVALLKELGVSDRAIESKPYRRMILEAREASLA